MSVIAYQGFVQIIKRYRGKYRGSNIYHNQGSTHLFKLLTKFLNDGAANRDIQPAYLDVGYEEAENENKKWTSCLYSKINITSRTETIITDTTTPAVICVWDISANQVAKSTDTKHQIKLRVYNGADNDASSYLMEVGLTESNGNPINRYAINPGESHEISWTMSFTNVGTQGK